MAAFKSIEADFVPYEAQTLKLKMKEVKNKLLEYSEGSISVNGIVLANNGKSYLTKALVSKSQAAVDISKAISIYMDGLNDINFRPVGFVTDSGPNVVAANKILLVNIILIYLLKNCSKYLKSTMKCPDFVKQSPKLKDILYEGEREEYIHFVE
uniref:MDD_C domain-containing protein n=1 Tax=Rhabditophanes sp. KR3021 TaxID=114890 RepID=A0AC35UA47_9BILA